MSDTPLHQEIQAIILDTLPVQSRELVLPDLSREAVAGMIDHTLLKPEATAAQIEKLCAEAHTHRFASVCVNPTHVALASRELAESGIPICTVIGFPLGATLTAVKVAEVAACVAAGATEVDMVINIGALKAGDYETVAADIQAVVDEAHRLGVLVKVIIETALLSDEEKVAATWLVKKSGAEFVKTSTGFSHHGATIPDVALMAAVVGSGYGIKAAGGVRSYEDALKMIAAGATRIGASAGVRIATDDN